MTSHTGYVTCVIAAVLLAGCGGGDDAEGAATSESPPAAAPAEDTESPAADVVATTDEDEPSDDATDEASNDATDEAVELTGPFGEPFTVEARWADHIELRLEVAEVQRRRAMTYDGDDPACSSGSGVWVVPIRVHLAAVGEPVDETQPSGTYRGYRMHVRGYAGDGTDADAFFRSSGLTLHFSAPHFNGGGHVCWPGTDVDGSPKSPTMGVLRVPRLGTGEAWDFDVYVVLRGEDQFEPIPAAALDRVGEVGITVEFVKNEVDELGDPTGETVEDFGATVVTQDAPALREVEGADFALMLFEPMADAR